MTSEPSPAQAERAAPPQSLQRMLLTLCLRFSPGHTAPDLTPADWRHLGRAFDKHSAWTSPSTPVGGLWHAAHKRASIREAMVTSSNPALRDLAARYDSANAMAAIDRAVQEAP